MGKRRLPKPGPQQERTYPMSQVRFDPDVLSPGDVIEYSLTAEVSPGPGQKAWVKWGTVSSVRTDEDPAEAVKRVATFVERGLDARINALSE